MILFVLLILNKYPHILESFCNAVTVTPLAELGPIQDHDIELYIKFLEEQAREDPKKFYASRFERKAGFVAKLQEIPLLEKCLNMVDKTCGTN